MTRARTRGSDGLGDPVAPTAAPHAPFAPTGRDADRVRPSGAAAVRPRYEYHMAKKMLIDATHPEETRVVVVDGNRVEDFDFESANKRQLAGNIYLAKVTRVEPSLQAAFVDYGGNRHGFLAFSEIHPDYYQIPVADRQALLAEEAALAAEADAAEDEDEKPKRRARRGARPAPRRPRRDDAVDQLASRVEATATSRRATPARDPQGLPRHRPGDGRGRPRRRRGRSSPMATDHATTPIETPRRRGGRALPGDGRRGRAGRHDRGRRRGRRPPGRPPGAASRRARAATRSRRSSRSGRSCWSRSSRRSAATRARR